MTSQNTVLVTGGAGFIGSQLRPRLARRDRRAGRQSRRPHLRRQPREPGLARRRPAPRLRAGRHLRPARCSTRLLAEHRPRAVVHFAAESHVDRSIHGPAAFVQTNVEGTLHAARGGARALGGARRGRAQRPSASSTSRPTRSTARSRPTRRPSPRAIRTSRTAPTRRARRRATTWCAPGTTPTACRCSPPTARNNYGPYHFPEKLIPLMIVNALAGKPLPVYGDGMQVRDWLYVERPLRRDPRGAGARPRRRDLQHRRLEREAQPRDRRTPSAPCSTSCGPIRQGPLPRA